MKVKIQKKKKQFFGLGLKKYNAKYSYLHGSGDQQYCYYAIGQFNFSDKYSNSIPGPEWINGNQNSLYYEVNLYT